jgi:predicted amidohydrolase
MKHLIALAQIDSATGNVSKNLEKHLEYIRRAKEGGADFVIFPELSLTGYSIRDMNWDVVVSDQHHPAFKALAKESKEISILAGGVEESAEFGLYNSAFLFDKGKLVHAHRKVYPPTYGMFEESRYFSSGKTARAAETSLGKLGVLVCEDLWHLSLPYLLAQQGAWMILGIIASPTRVTAGEKEPTIGVVNAEHCRTYARLLSTYIVFCNRVGYEDGVGFWGGSIVVAPSGEIVGQAKFLEEDLVFVEVDTNEVRRARRFSRHFIDEDPTLLLRELRRVLKP